MTYSVEMHDGIISLSETTETTTVEHFPAHSAVKDLTKKVRSEMFWHRIAYVAAAGAFTVAALDFSDAILGTSYMGMNPDINPVAVGTLYSGIGLLNLANAGSLKQSAKENKLKLAQVNHFINSPIRR